MSVGGVVLNEDGYTKPNLKDNFIEVDGKQIY